MSNARHHVVTYPLLIGAFVLIIYVLLVPLCKWEAVDECVCIHIFPLTLIDRLSKFLRSEVTTVTLVDMFSSNI